MSLNDLERRNFSYFAFFSPNATDFQADYITVVEARPIVSVKCCLPVPSSTFGENYTMCQKNIPDVLATTRESIVGFS